MTHAALVALLLASGACTRDRGDGEPAQPACAGPSAIWRTPTGERWMVLHEGDDLTIYPMFPDVAVPASSATEVGPRVMDLSLDGTAGGTGVAHRRYMRGRDVCDATAAIRITACAAGAMEFVLSDPAPPTGFSPCTWGRPPPSRVERWKRDD